MYDLHTLAFVCGYKNIKGNGLFPYYGQHYEAFPWSIPMYDMSVERVCNLLLISDV